MRHTWLILLLLTGTLLWAGDSPLTAAGSDTVPDPFMKNLGLLSRDGRTVVFTDSQIRTLHPLNPGGLLWHIPGFIVARNSFAGTLSDWRSLGHELYWGDKPVSVRVDGVELADLSADRVYWNNAPLTGAESFSATPDGGLSGGRMALDVRRPDDFVVSPVTRVYWETGPFDMTGVQFLFRRSLGPQNGLSVAMEKIWQAEELGFFFGPNRYSHPAAISDIYGAFLRRPDSQYVSEGYYFENDFKRWNAALSSRSVPGVLLTAGFDYLRDFQDDFRNRAGDSTGYLNFAARRLSDRFYLKGRTLFSGPWSVQAQVYRETARLRYLDSSESPRAGDSATFSQGADLAGALLETRWKRGVSEAWITAETRSSDFLGRNASTAFAEDRITAGFQQRFDSLTAFPLRIRIENDLRRDSRNASRGAINTRATFSPKIDAAALFLGQRLRIDAGAGVDRRFPRAALLYLENPKLNYRPEPDSGFARIVTSSAWTGAGVTAGRWDFSYRAEFRSAPNPALLMARFDTSGRLEFVLNRGRIDRERVLDQEFAAGLSLGAFDDRLSVAAATIGYDYAAGGSEGFTAWHAVNRIRWKGRFVHERLEMKVSWFTEFRPEAWSPDFHAGPLHVTLPWFLSFDAELEFTIKRFNFFTRLDNLSNQVIRFDPGYLLPGPVIRWGVDWTFKG